MSALVPLIVVLVMPLGVVVLPVRLLRGLPWLEVVLPPMLLTPPPPPPPPQCGCGCCDDDKVKEES